MAKQLDNITQRRCRSLAISSLLLILTSYWGAPVSLPSAVAAPIRGLEISDNTGKALSPSAVLRIQNDIYFLTPSSLWCVPNATDFLPPLHRLKAQPLRPPRGKIAGTPFHELNDFVFIPKRNSIAVLDKSGDVFEYSLITKTWSLLLDSATSSGEPHYVDLCAAPDHAVLLDPELNQILRVPGNSRQFSGQLPWRLRKGDISVADGVSVAYDKGVLVLHRSGRITVFGSATSHGSLEWKPPSNIRPSRLFAYPGGPLYVVDRENCRVFALTPSGNSLKWNQYLFAADSDLRGMVPGLNAFWILDGNRLLLRKLADADSPDAKPSKRALDNRLAGLSIPVKNGALPRHTGVFPGARRLYRRGIHAGLDLFNDPGCGTMVKMDTPVLAAKDGVVTRADWQYKDLSPAQYWAKIQACRDEHDCSETNENYFRGRQVEIDHGDGVITRYAHLNGIKAGLKVGTKVSRGDVIGYVGVSGTSNTLPGHPKYPHVHFEMWVDGKYLGYGLTPAETICVFEDIFGALCKRGGS